VPWAGFATSLGRKRDDRKVIRPTSSCIARTGVHHIGTNFGKYSMPQLLKCQDMQFQAAWREEG
jgi:hypothetical protein